MTFYIAVIKKSCWLGHPMGAKHCGSWSVFTVERYVLRWGGMGLLLGWAAWWKHTPYRQERL